MAEDDAPDAGAALDDEALDAGAAALDDCALDAEAADVVLELVVLLELLQAETARAMMPMAATPVMDLRNMETFRTGRLKLPTIDDDQGHFFASCGPQPAGVDW